MTVKTWIANPDVWPKYDAEPTKEVTNEKLKPRPKPEKPRKAKPRGRPVGAKDSYQRQRQALAFPCDVLDIFAQAHDEIASGRARVQGKNYYRTPKKL